MVKLKSKHIVFILVGLAFWYISPSFGRDVHIRGYINISGSTHNKQINILRTALRGQIITLYIQSNGGYPQGTKRIARAMRTSKATVRVVVPRYARSAGALLMCHGKSLRVSPKASIMFHLPGHKTRSGRKVIYDRRHPSYAAADRLFQKCKKYLTRAQISSYYRGEDVWIRGSQVNGRR